MRLKMGRPPCKSPIAIPFRAPGGKNLIQQGYSQRGTRNKRGCDLSYHKWMARFVVTAGDLIGLAEEGTQGSRLLA